MEKQYPQLYKQGNYPQRLGTDKSTVSIAQSGCFVSSLAMKSCFYGHQVDPLQLNTALVAKGIFLQENLLPDNALALLFSDVHYVKTFDYEPIATDLNNIKNLLDDPATTLTIRINLGNGNLHFVEAVACDGTSLHIANPLSGQIEDFTRNYGSPITANLHVLVYTGPILQPVTAINPAPADNATPLAQRFTQAINKSNNFDVVCTFLGIPQDQAVQKDVGANLVIDKFKFLQKQIEDDSHTIEDLQKARLSPPIGAAPVRVDPPTVVVAPQTAPDAPQPAAVFKDGSNPVGSNYATTVPAASVPKESPAPQSGPVSFLEFAKAIWKILFV